MSEERTASGFQRLEIELVREKRLVEASTALHSTLDLGGPKATLNIAMDGNASAARPAASASLPTIAADICPTGTNSTSAVATHATGQLARSRTRNQQTTPASGRRRNGRSVWRSSSPGMT